MHVRNWELSLPPCRMLICFWSGLPLPTPGRWKCWGNACVLKKAKKKVVFVQWLSPVQLFATPWTAACQAPLASTISQRLLKFMSIESVMLSDHLILRLPFSSSLLSFPALGSFPMSQLFASGGKVLELQLQHQSFQWIFMLNFLQHLLVWSPYSPTESQESSPALDWKHQFFGIQPSSLPNSHPYMTTGNTILTFYFFLTGQKPCWLYGSLYAK